MQLDIRIPIGALFTMLGVILTSHGLLADADNWRRSLGHDVNLSWGLVILATGLLFLWLARRGRHAARPAGPWRVTISG